MVFASKFLEPQLLEQQQLRDCTAIFTLRDELAHAGKAPVESRIDAVEGLPDDLDDRQRLAFAFDPHQSDFAHDVVVGAGFIERVLAGEQVYAELASEPLQA